MGRFWKWMVGIYCLRPQRFIETNSLSSVGHRPSFYEYKVQTNKNVKHWTFNPCLQLASNCMVKWIMVDGVVTVVSQNLHFCNCQNGDRQTLFGPISFSGPSRGGGGAKVQLVSASPQSGAGSQLHSPVSMVTRLRCKSSRLGKVTSALAVNRWPGKVQGCPHMRCWLKIGFANDNDDYIIMICWWQWQIRTPNKAWWHEYSLRQIQSSFQRGVTFTFDCCWFEVSALMEYLAITIFSLINLPMDHYFDNYCRGGQRCTIEMSAKWSLLIKGTLVGNL